MGYEKTEMTSIADNLEPFHITLGPHSISDEITMQIVFLSLSQHLVPLEQRIGLNPSRYSRKPVMRLIQGLISGKS